MPDRPNPQSADTSQQNVCGCGDPSCNYVENLQAGIAWLRAAAGVEGER